MCNTFKSLIVPEYNFIVFRPSCVPVWVLSCFSCAHLFVTLWTGACQAPLVHGILQTRMSEWIAAPFSGELPDPGIKPASLLSPGLAGRFLTFSVT